MNIYIVYDTYFSNTKKIAYALMEYLEKKHQVAITKIDEMNIEALKEAELLIIGSPTRAFRPTEKITAFLKGITQKELKVWKFLFFDTGIKSEDINVPILKWLAGKLGYAAPYMEKLMRKKGADILGISKGFFVADSEGPLKEGEQDRAVKWLQECGL